MGLTVERVTGWELALGAGEGLAGASARLAIGRDRRATSAMGVTGPAHADFIP
jgi:hypothetical protein